MTENKPKTGLKELPQDARDFALGSIIPVKKFPKLEDLPEEFILETSLLYDQLDDQCTGNTTALIIGTNEGVPISAEWMFAKSKELTGDVESWGQDLRSAFKVGVKFGALPLKNAPFRQDKGSEFLRDIKNWPKGLDFYAAPQKQKTFWKVTGPYDNFFHNIKATIFYLYSIGQKQGVGIGLLWGYPTQQYVLSEIKNQGVGHALSVIGWKKEGLVLQNSWGPGAGLNGKHIITREVINHFADKYGAFVYMDLPREKAEYMLDHGIKTGDNWLVQLWKVIKSFFWMDLTFGAGRDSGWNKLRDRYFAANPLCEMCGRKGKQVHHIIPVFQDKSKELLWENLITGCKKCHLDFYHLGNYRSWNESIKEDARYWRNKKEKRP